MLISYLNLKSKAFTPLFHRAIPENGFSGLRISFSFATNKNTDNKNDYRFELLDLSAKGISEISNLLTSVFGETTGLTPEFVNWEYYQNPVGKAVGFNAFAGNTLAAHYVTQPLVSEFGDKKVKGLLSLNIATHADHRGKKLFTILADKPYEYALEQGYQFVIGVANANSTPGFLKNLKFKLIKPLDVKIGVGKFPVNLEKCQGYQRFCDKEMLEWRLNNPKLGYEIRRQKDHFVVLAPTGNYGIKAIIGYFPVSLFSDKIKNLSKSATSANPTKIWMGIDEGLNWKNTLYFNFPDRYKPSPLNLIFRDLSESGLTLDAANLKFMSLDFDAY